MRYILVLIITTIFIWSCSGSKIQYDNQTIQMLKDPKLFYAFDNFSKGISLGMIGLEIRFEQVDYEKAGSIIFIRGKVIDETSKEPVSKVLVYIAQKLNYDNSLKSYKIVLSDSIQSKSDGSFEINTKLRKSTVITSKVIGHYGRIYNIGNLERK